MRPGPQRGLGTCPLLGCCCCCPSSSLKASSSSSSHPRSTSSHWIVLLGLFLHFYCSLPHVHGVRQVLQPPAVGSTTFGDRLGPLPLSLQRGTRMISADRLKALPAPPRGGPAAEFNPSHPPFHPVITSLNMLGHHHPNNPSNPAGASHSLTSGILGGGMGATSNSGVAQSMVPAAAASSISSGPPIGGNPEGSIIRLMSKSYRYLQISPNGTVTATTHEGSEFAILEQSAVKIGHVYIRGIASRHYLCLNKCGMLYGSRNLSEECILRENIENNWYNTYTSSRYSTEQKALYVALSSSTGSACKLRLHTLRSPEGRIISSLGTNDQFTQFFPVRNVTLPEGMNLASLSKQWASSAPHHNHHHPNHALLLPADYVLPPEASRCADRCTKVPASNSPSTHPPSPRPQKPNRSPSTTKKKSKCPPCLPPDVASTGGQRLAGERCRRPKHCRRNHHTPAPTGSSVSSIQPPTRKSKPKTQEHNARRPTTKRPDVESGDKNHRNRGDATESKVTKKPKKTKNTPPPLRPVTSVATTVTAKRNRIRQQNQQQQSSGQGRRRPTNLDQFSPDREVDESGRVPSIKQQPSSSKLLVPPHKVRHAHRKIRVHPELFLPDEMATPRVA